MQELYEQALDCDISPEEFWGYSPNEISDIIESYFRKKSRDIKWQVTHDFIIAEVETRYMFGKKEQDTPHPWDYYDELFAEDKIKYEKQKEQKAFEDYKEKRRLYVEAFNKRRRQGT